MHFCQRTTYTGSRLFSNDSATYSPCKGKEKKKNNIQPGALHTSLKTVLLICWFICKTKTKTNRKYSVENWWRWWYKEWLWLLSESNITGLKQGASGTNMWLRSDGGALGLSLETWDWKRLTAQHHVFHNKGDCFSQIHVLYQLFQSVNSANCLHTCTVAVFFCEVLDIERFGGCVLSLINTALLLLLGCSTCCYS